MRVAGLLNSMEKLFPSPPPPPPPPPPPHTHTHTHTHTPKSRLYLTTTVYSILVQLKKVAWITEAL